MKSISTFAVAVSLALGAGAATPAVAQDKGGKAKAQSEAAPAANARKFNISKEARNPIAALQTAVNAGDAAAIAAALTAAEAAAKTPDDRYLIAQLRLNQAIKLNDDAAKVAAIDAVIASGSATAEETPKLYQALAALHFNAKNFPAATASLERLIQLQPTATDPLLQLAEVHAQMNKRAEAVAVMDRAISVAKSSGQTVPENWYKRALRFAYEGKLAPQTTKLGRDLVSAYPTASNWSDVLQIYRDGSRLDRAGLVDVYRLMRAAKVLRGERDVFEYANYTHESGLPGETKAVLDEAVGARIVDPNKQGFKELINLSATRVTADRASLDTAEKQALAGGTAKVAMNTADAFLGYGDYARAAALYRVAIQKGGIDANVANTRLGIALALAGQRSEAESVLKTVTGPRADLASYWLVWLAQRG